MKLTTRVATLNLSERKASPGGLKRYPATLSTETPVPRRDRYGSTYGEILSHAPGAVDLSRAPIPLLESHDGSRVNIGVVQNIRIENRKLRGDLVLGKSARAKELADDIDAGVVSGISIGYGVSEIPDDGETRTATRWVLAEVSIVSIPADKNAGIFRSATNNQTRSNDVKNRKLNAPDDGNGSGGGEIAQKERERIDGIKTANRTSRLEESIGAEMIRTGVPLDKAREQFLEILAARSDGLLSPAAGAGGGYRGSVTGGDDQQDKFVRGASAWLFEKANISSISEAKKRGVKGFKDVELDGGEFRGLSLFDLAKESLERQGIRTRGMDRQRIAGLALTTRASTGDFAVLFENAIGKTLLASYAIQQDTWSRFCKVMTVPDFRSVGHYRAGLFGTLPVVMENAEYQQIPIPDGSKVSISTETRGGIIGLSRQAIINDDMGAISDVATKLGRAARLSIEAAVYAQLALNGGLGPTVGAAPFFDDAANGNVNTTSVLGVAGLDSDRLKMAQQRDLDDQEYLDLRPAVLLVPSSLRGAAQILNTSSFDHTTALDGKPNIVKGLFTDVVDSPRITGTRRYLFASPAIAPAICVVFLEGQGEGPTLESEQAFTTDGIKWKARIDFKVNMFDPKGAITSAGTA